MKFGTCDLAERQSVIQSDYVSKRLDILLLTIICFVGAHEWRALLSELRDYTSILSLKMETEPE